MANPFTLRIVHHDFLFFATGYPHDNVWKIVDPVFGRWLEKY